MVDKPQRNQTMNTKIYLFSFRWLERLTTYLTVDIISRPPSSNISKTITINYNIIYQISNMLPDSCLLAWSCGWRRYGFADIQTNKSIRKLWSVSHQ